MIHIERGDGIDMADFYIQHKRRLPYSFDQFLHALNDWNIWRVFLNGARVATVLELHGAGHVARYQKSHVGIQAMRQIMDVLGIWKTEVTDSFKAGHALAKRLGFKPCDKEKGVTHYVRVSHDKK